MAEKCVEKGCVSASEFKKKAYRDYLYSSGTVESLTQDHKIRVPSTKTLFIMAIITSYYLIFKRHSCKIVSTLTNSTEFEFSVLVMLYETHNKPENALEFIRKALGGPTIADLEQLKQEKEALQTMHDALVKQHAETCEQLLLLAATEENSSEAKSPSGKTSQRKSLI
ncbi:uncharacterized protein [Physcomitrium patens]|uniref:uncharacterized protein isoform X2 n=1 Tax=Physcomitrium patens TaxID=3218 RepID=UPI003CCCED06